MCISWKKKKVNKGIANILRINGTFQKKKKCYTQDSKMHGSNW